MKQGRARDASEDRTDIPAWIKVYLEYARENIKRSRILSGRDDLRYALFSANEGLELCIKAHMLHYGIIDKAVAARHFPYLAAVKKMEETTESIIKNNPADKEQLDPALASLATLKKAVKMVTKKELQIPLLKVSLGMEPSDDERSELDKLAGKFSLWDEQISGITSEPQGPRNEDHSGCLLSKRTESCVDALNTPKDENNRRSGPWPRLLPEYDDMLPDRIPVVMALFPLAPLFRHLYVVTFSFAHQQISRYPTNIDGTDSRDVYMANKDGVKDLLERIYAASEEIANHLEHGDPLLARYAAEACIDVKKLAPSWRGAEDTGVATS